MEDKKKEDQHKGVFVGGYFHSDQLEKIVAIEKAYDKHFGEAGRNRTRALRWLIDSFRPEWIADFPKSPTLVGKTAQTEAMTN